ncbi:MAG: L,D-transpeptidase [Rhizobiaceae bacterium]|nr:L,D-transpeptidase [Rhizobiaceae bacterium]MCV0407048.1 L,D-transpeptidase [Rhizobiaceae bacterium]
MKGLLGAVIVSAAVMLGGSGGGALAEANWMIDPATGTSVLRDQVPRTPRRSAHQRSDKSPIPRQIISYDGRHGPDTIIVNTSERRLYYTLGNGRAIKYGIGVGREGFTWAGTNRISRKAEWPGWTPPPQMRRREAAQGRILPAYMPGGPENPLGARALYIGSTLYRIHGTNQPWTIGQAMSSGCIRMANEDVMHLYDQVKVGTRVVVLR